MLSYGELFCRCFFMSCTPVVKKRKKVIVVILSVDLSICVVVLSTSDLSDRLVLNLE